MFTLARTAKDWKKLFDNDGLKGAHSPTTLRFVDSSPYASNFIPTRRDSFSAWLTMSNIKNYPKNKNKIIQAIRGLLAHRATWLYLLLDEAEKRGINTEDFAKSAVMRCGCFQGDQLIAKAGTRSLKGLKKILFTMPARMVFEMKILACMDDRLDIDFHYCPLVAAWQSHGVADEQIAKLCDIAMEGDRGIAKSFGCELVLGETIAKGYSKCEIRFKRLKE
jgi:hypothetical protein